MKYSPMMKSRYQKNEEDVKANQEKKDLSSLSKIKRIKINYSKQEKK